jgi:hypothetical protein
MNQATNQIPQGLCPVLDGFADGITVLSDVSVNRICAAVGAIETIATLLANREHGFGAVYLTHGHAAGLLQALSICGEMINAEATGSGHGIHLETVNPGSGKVMELARQALQEARP